MTTTASDPDAVVVVLTTVDSETSAQGLARQLVDERLAGCVNIVAGVTSVYRWQGAIETNGEWLLLLKTRRGDLERLEARVMALHPYDTPEWLVLAVEAVGDAYRQWLLAGVGRDPGAGAPSV